MDTDFLHPGSLLRDGAYRIVRTLGQGGFGITYLAEQVALGREVAIKEFFLRDLCERQGDDGQITMGTTNSRATAQRYREKFLKEARNLARLNHPHIVKVIDIFEENGTAYFVMDFCPGGSLAQLIGQRGRLPEKEAAQYVCQLAAALAHLHSHRMNHLDVKPSNVMLDAMGKVVLIDFGLSKQYDEQGEQTSTTPIGISEGYAPLEQYGRGGVSVFSPESDVYSLGATYYKLLTGETPPKASDIVNEGGVPTLLLRQCGVSLASVDLISRSMEPRQKQRLNDAGEYLRVLGGGIQPTPAEQEPEELVTVVVDTDDEPSPAAAPTPASHTVPMNAAATPAIHTIPMNAASAPMHTPASSATTPMAGGTSRTAPKATAEQPADTAPEGGKKKGKGKTCLVVAIVMAVLGIGGIVLLIAAICAYNIFFANTDNGHEYVDLGLPSGTLWATCNVGADSPEEAGYYFSWAETSPKDTYTWDTLDDAGTDDSNVIQFTSYVCDDSFGTEDDQEELTLMDDAATINWSGKWRTPTLEQFEELLDEENCTWEWTKEDGTDGYLVTSVRNGNSIFLPVNGYQGDDGLTNSDRFGYYWSRTLNKVLGSNAYGLDFGHQYTSTGFDLRYLGRNIRPVTKE